MVEEFRIEKLIRGNISKLVPYTSARTEYPGEEGILLDANENALGSPIGEIRMDDEPFLNLNRYPDPFQKKLKAKLSGIKGVPADNIFIGNGSDEAMDLLFRAFCNPGKDNIIICPPTYYMYEVLANTNEVEVKEVALDVNFQLNVEGIAEAVDENTKLIFICSPNNPTGNSLYYEDIEAVLNNFEGIVVLDEAYINYSRQRSFIAELTTYPNLVVLQTLSKAWGLAALRLGIAYAGSPLINILNLIKPPYNINGLSQEIAVKALNELELVNKRIKEIVKLRSALAKELSQFSFVKAIYPSDANFILIKVPDVTKLHQFLLDNKIVTRNRGQLKGCENCLRITVGSEEENRKLIDTLQKFPID